MAGSSAGHIDLDLDLNYGAFQRQLSGIAGMADNLVGNAFKSLGGIIAGAFAVGGLVHFGKTAIELASDLQEVQNVVDVTFGGMAQDINNWSKSLINDFGLSELAGKKYASTMGAMLKSSGMAGIQMEQLSKQLTELSADMASFYNLSNQEAFEKVFSGMTGETEPLKALGINMSVANMEAYALSQGINKAWNSMSQLEQTTLRASYLMKTTADAQGDFARTSNSWANQVKVMGEQWRIFQGTMGAGFINILTPVLRGLNWLIAKLQVAAAYFKAFTELIFGNAAGGSSGGGAAVQPISDMGTAAGDTAGALGDLGGAADKTGKKAKKAGKDVKGSLAGFDQLNILADSAAGALDDAAGSVAGVGAGLGAGLAGMGGVIDLGTPDIDVSPITAKMETFIENLKGWLAPLAAISLDPLKDSLSRLYTALLPFGENIAVGLKWLYLNVLVPLATWTIQEALPAFLDVLSAALNVLNSVIELLKPAFLWLWNNMLLPLAQWTGDVIVAGLKKLAEVLNSISDWIDKNSGGILNITKLLENLSNWITANQQTFINMGIAIASFFAAFKIAQLILEIAPFISMLTTMISSGGLLTTVMAGLAAAISAITAPVVLITATLGLLIYTFVDLYKSSESFRAKITELGNTWRIALEPLATFVSTVLTDAWNKILLPVIKFFLDTLIPNVIDIFKKLWEKVFVPLANFIGTVLQPVFKILGDFLTMLWKNIVLPLAQAVGEVLKAAWNAIYEILTKTVIPIVEKVISVLQFLWENVINPIIKVLWDNLKPAFDTVFEGIKGVIEGLKTTLLGVITFITGIFTGDWKKAWEGVKTVFRGVFDTLYSIVQTPLNMIVDAINKVIDGLNSMDITMPEWMGGGSFGLNIPRIPRLARGGIVSSPTIAQIGEAGPEAVVPLKNTAFVDTLASALGNAVMAAMALNNSGGQGDRVQENQEIVMQMDGTVLARLLAPLLAKEQQRTGTSIIRNITTT